MPLAKDLSHLPSPASTSDDACPPDTEPRFVHLLAERWAEENAARNAEYKRRTRFHLSDAGKCSRAVAYAALEVPASNPMDLTGVHNTRIGSMLHEAWQAVVAERFPDAEIEPRHLILDGDGSGYSDAIFFVAGTTAYELKSIGGYGYKMAVGERGAPQGPNYGHLVQGALNAKAADADELVIGYLSKEAISVAAAKRKRITELGRFCAEWTFTRDQYEPIAEAEEARVRGILGLLDEGEGTLPARKIPGDDLPRGAVIVDPASGQWQVLDREGEILDVGSYWSCQYCKWQDTCSLTPAGRTPLAPEVRAVLGLNDETEEVGQ